MAAAFLTALFLVAFCQGDDFSGIAPVDRSIKNHRQHRFVRSESRASHVLETSTPVTEGIVAAAGVGGSNPVAYPGAAMVETAEDLAVDAGDPVSDVHQVMETVAETQADMSHPYLSEAKWTTSDDEDMKEDHQPDGNEHEHKKKVIFKDGEVTIPKGSWIQSKFKLSRPTVVQAKIKSDGAAGDIAMTVFAKDHLASSIYSVTTGFGEDNSQARAMPGDNKSSDVFADDSSDNTANWQTIRFELDTDITRMLVDGSLLHASDNVAEKDGHVQFIAMDQPMKVKEVDWRLHCKWSMWTDGACSVTCGPGRLKRSRKKSRDPTFGGDTCEGRVAYTELCHAGPCSSAGAL